MHFTLLTGTAASLEPFDVAGRRIATREVGSFGAGQHTLDLGEGRRLAPGLHPVCLWQDANVRVTRVIAFGMPSGQAQSREVSATYTRDESKLTIQWQGAGATIGAVDAGTFTMQNEGQVFLYRRTY